MHINWNNIGAVDGQALAFEELVCQLAGKEKIPGQKEFIRVGTPDAGKECIWEMDDGSSHMWQAKYFTSSLTNGQWKQVDKSVRKAIDSHKSLTKFYVAIPVNPPDGKVKGKTSMLQKWKDHVAEWEEYAKTQKMKVSFVYWGKHELEKRLIKKENEGLRYYFFNQLEFSDEWFANKNKEAIDALGPRYSPELNFDLPIAEFVSGFERNEQLGEILYKPYDLLLDKCRQFRIQATNKEVIENSKLLSNSIQTFRRCFESLSLKGTHEIPIELLKKCLKDIKDRTYVLSEIFEKLKQNEPGKDDEKGLRNFGQSKKFDGELRNLRGILNAIGSFNEILRRSIFQIANKPYVILTGHAGMGKSHTLADVVTSRSSDGKTSLLLLGESFSTNEMPWTQILHNLLRINGDEYRLLGALNAKAESMQERIVFIIDALNEGNGRQIWPNHLKSFIETFKKYPWLALVVSIRTTNEKLIAPEKTIGPDVATRIVHNGFQGVEFEAANHFFRFYGIDPPGSPLLHPEFQNPLFLKLFCKGLQSQGLKQIPPGYQGISLIIEYFLNGIEEQLSRPKALDYDVNLKLLHKAVDQILLKMIEEESDYISYNDASSITTDVFIQHCGSSDRQYLKRLISEGVLNEDWHWQDENNQYDVIRFAYQRLHDHLIVKTMLDKYLDTANPKSSFVSGPLKSILKNESNRLYNQNLIEALTIQVPERTGKDLQEIAPQAAVSNAVARATIHGLGWRNSKSISENTIHYINGLFAKNSQYFYRFLDVSLSYAARPDFYFNADFLHGFLYKLELAERDELWTTWLQNKYGEDRDYNSVNRLVNWAWNDSPKSDISNEACELAATAISWFLTSSNRYLRDSATKALVSLLEQRIPVLIEVLKRFENVNDPYVYERLFAVAYGCALRTENLNELIPLSEYIYQTIFSRKTVYPHILLRDYARGVIEFCDHKALSLSFNIEKVRPPYNSDLPNTFPTTEETDKKFMPQGENRRHYGSEWGATAIFRSMAIEGAGRGLYGDFGRYIFQSAVENWKVDIEGVCNYAIERIFNMGYDPKIFTDFDTDQGSGRHTGYLERIGKKYQWIAFHEVLARISDNCQLYDGNKWSKKEKFKPYNGPWDPYVRDIDPSFVIKATLEKNEVNELKNKPWWIPSFDTWKGLPGDWKMLADDLPKMLDLISVKDEKGENWVILNAHPDWMEPKKPGANPWENRRKVRCEISSWLVKPYEVRKMLAVDSTENGWSNWDQFPSPVYELFSREYFWSPSWKNLELAPNSGSMYHHELTDPKTNKTIARPWPTTTYFLWEKENDCSKDSSIHIFKPSFLLSFGLQPGKQEGSYVNENNEIICFDPSVVENGPSCLLYRKDALVALLKKLGYRLVWLIQSEKQIMGDEELEDVNFDNRISGLYHMSVSGEVSGDEKVYFREYGK